MNKEWKSFLVAQGAQFDESNQIISFGSPEIEHLLVKHGPIITDLSKEGLIEVTGEDAFEFLQSQFSNDLKEVSEQVAQLSAYCDPKGKVIALITIFKKADSYFLNFDETLKETVLKKLTMFKMRSKVTLEEVSETFLQIGYAGEFADLDLQRDLSTKLKEVFQVQQVAGEFAKNVIAIKVPGPYHNYKLFGPLDELQAVWKVLKANGEAIGAQDWSLLKIVSGQPTVNLATSGEFIAQFLNLDKLNVINFKKGCFPGQEVIARMHYRGKVTKRMLRIHTEGSALLKPASVLRLKDSSDRVYKFTIISSAPDIYLGTVSLAVVTIKSLESVTGDLKSEAGDKYVVEPMPYDLVEE